MNMPINHIQGGPGGPPVLQQPPPMPHHQHPGHQQPVSSNETVLRLDASLPVQPSLTHEEAANFLIQAIRHSHTRPYRHEYIDKPGDGEMHIICQVPSLPVFSADGLRYLEGEHRYSVPMGNYELEVAETKYGFIPGMHEPSASRVRRKYRFTKGNVPAVVLVHYTRGPACAIPPHMANIPVRSYPLVPSTEPAVFVMGEKAGQKVMMNPPAGPAVNHHHPPPGPHGIPPGVQMGHHLPPSHHVQAQAQAVNAQSAQLAAMNARKGTLPGVPGVPKPGPRPGADDDEEDESDVISHRDLATMRFTRNHEFLAELFSPEPLPAPSSGPSETQEELEAKLAKLNAEIEELNQKTSDLQASRQTTGNLGLNMIST
ncbi:hypothetical protein FRC02_008274 [Tulasnella sp. 418]|nr:hypothetical protein FRC02_008274 [Tulasnella sp. 418]